MGIYALATYRHQVVTRSVGYVL